MEHLKEEDQLDIGKQLKQLFDALFRAVTSEQPRNDKWKDDRT